VRRSDDGGAAIFGRLPLGRLGERLPALKGGRPLRIDSAPFRERSPAGLEARCANLDICVLPSGLEASLHVLGFTRLALGA